MDAAWQRYEKSAEDELCSAVALRAEERDSVPADLDADTVINEYRSSDAPTVTEKEWVTAHDVLARALQIDPSTAMSGQTLPNRRSSQPYSWNQPRRGKLFSEARAKFEQAADLIPAHPIRILGSPPVRLFASRCGSGRRRHESGRQAGS